MVESGEMGYGEGAEEDLYCFRCHDNDVTSDVWVHVDVLWDDFVQKLEGRFGRPVYIVYRRDGESKERPVQTEEAFEDLCEYLDDSQLTTLHVEIRGLRRRKTAQEQAADGGGDLLAPRSHSSNGGVEYGGRAHSPNNMSPDLSFSSAHVPKDSLAARKPNSRRIPQRRPATAGTQRGGPGNITSKAYAPQRKAAWDGNTSPRKKTGNKNALGNLDKETMMDKIMDLQRQVNALEENKVKLHTETVRLELELSKVLRENEELFKAKGGSALLKGGASSNLVNKMKIKIKELEAMVSTKDGEMKKLKSDTRVTRLTELEVEKNTYLHEVRRLQRENRQIKDQYQISAAKQNSEEEDINYRKLYAMYETLLRDNDELKKKMRSMQVNSTAMEDDKSVLERECEKLKIQLQAAKSKASKAAAPADRKESRAGSSKDSEALQNAQKRVNELLAVQKRLDLALNRAYRERDTAEMARSEKEEEVKKLHEQKRSLQMQLHSLGAKRSGPSTGTTKRGDRSDMICFFCIDDRKHVEVQFVDFRVGFGEFSDILQRLYGKGPLGFTYESNSNNKLTKVAVTTAVDFDRCKEWVEDEYCGQGDQALIITIAEQAALAELSSTGVPDGGASVLSNTSIMQQAMSPVVTSNDSKSRNVGDKASSDYAPSDFEKARSVSGNEPQSLTLECFFEENHMGDLKLLDTMSWHDVRAHLKQLVGVECHFTFPQADQSPLVVSDADEWAQCVEVMKQQYYDLSGRFEIDIVKEGREVKKMIWEVAAGEEYLGQHIVTDETPWSTAQSFLAKAAGRNAQYCFVDDNGETYPMNNASEYESCIKMMVSMYQDQRGSFSISVIRDELPTPKEVPAPAEEKQAEPAQELAPPSVPASAVEQATEEFLQAPAEKEAEPAASDEYGDEFEDEIEDEDAGGPASSEAAAREEEAQRHKEEEEAREKERVEKDRQERERAEQERAEQQEQDRLSKEKAERERIEKERLEQEREERERQQAAQEQSKAEQDRKQREEEEKRAAEEVQRQQEFARQKAEAEERERKEKEEQEKERQRKEAEEARRKEEEAAAAAAAADAENYAEEDFEEDFIQDDDEDERRAPAEDNLVAEAVDEEGDEPNDVELGGAVDDEEAYDEDGFDEVAEDAEDDWGADGGGDIVDDDDFIEDDDGVSAGEISDGEPF